MKRNVFLLTLAAALTLSAGATPIRFGTWNIRLSVMDKYEKDPKFPKWEERMPHVTGLIKEKGFDLMGLQEVTTPQAEVIRAALPGWKLVGVATNDAERSRCSHANGILYRTDRFAALRWGRFALSETPEVPGSRSWDTKCVRSCTCAVMEDLVDHRRFLVFNTHFDHRGQVAREKGMELVLARIEAARRNTGLPVILCGDFKSVVTTPQIEAAKKALRLAYDVSETPPKGPARTDNEWKFRDPSQETYGPRIDHVFLTDGAKVRSYETFGDFFGDGIYPSDHFPIKAVLELPDNNGRKDN